MPVASEAPAAHSVAVWLEGGDRATLLSLASALHRRGVDVLSAELSRQATGRRTFEAMIEATPRQARTVEATLRNLVHVTEVSVVRRGGLVAVEGRSHV